MTWEEKVKSVTINNLFLMRDSHGYNGNYSRYFTLFYSGSRDNDQHQKGVAYLERLINEGQLETAKETAKKLAGQLDFFRKHVALAKAYAKIGGKLDVRTSSSYNNTCESEVDGKLTTISNFFRIATTGEYYITLPNGYNMDTVDKFILKASRIIRDVEVRCLKHPRFKTV